MEEGEGKGEGGARLSVCSMDGIAVLDAWHYPRFTNKQRGNAWPRAEIRCLLAMCTILPSLPTLKDAKQTKEAQPTGWMEL